MTLGQSLHHGMFRAGLINIVIGASGAGKTTWVLQLLESLHLGKAFLGIFDVLLEGLPKTHYACFDRSTTELDDKWASINLPKDKFTAVTYYDRLDSKDITPTIFAETPEGTEILVIDGAGILVEHAISQYHVARFLSKLQRFAKGRGLTLILIHHTAKAKGNQSYDDPREKGMGSGAWCQMAACSVVLEKFDSKDVANQFRTAWILRNDQRQIEQVIKQNDLNGRLEASSQEEAKASVKEDKKDDDTDINVLVFMTPGTEYTAALLASDIGVSRQTVTTHLRTECDRGTIEKVKYGVYRLK